MDADGDDDLWVMKGGKKPALVIFRYIPNRVPVGNASAHMTKTVIEGIPPGRSVISTGMERLTWPAGRTRHSRSTCRRQGRVICSC